MVRVFKCFASLLLFALFTIPLVQAKPYRSNNISKKETAEYYYNKGCLSYEKGDDLSAVELLGKARLLDVDKKYSDSIEYRISNLNWKAFGDMDNGDRQKDIRILEATIKYFPKLKVAGYAEPLLLDGYTIRLTKIKGTADKYIDTKTEDELSDLITEIILFKDAYSGRTVPQEIDQLLNDCHNQAPRIKAICEKNAKVEEEKRLAELKVKKEKQEELAREKKEALEIKKEERARLAQEKKEELSGEKQSSPVDTNK